MQLLKIQNICVLVSGVFALFIFSSIIFNSFNRQSVLNSTDEFEDGSLESSAEGYFELNNFDRFEVKQGLLSWRIKADKARYYATEKLTQIVNAVLNFHRTDGTTMEVSSARAKVFGEAQGASKAELEGDVKVLVSDGISVFGQYAVYQAAESKVSLPDGSVIKGKGFEVAGEIMDVMVETKLVSVRGNVRSIFEPDAKLPKKSGLMKMVDKTDKDTK